MIRNFFRNILKPLNHKKDNKLSQGFNVDLAILTGEEFEFLLTPGNLEINSDDFDKIMTPDTLPIGRKLSKTAGHTIKLEKMNIHFRGKYQAFK